MSSVLTKLFAVIRQTIGMGPQDFAYAIAIHADAQDALYEIKLPAAVYRGITRSDLRRHSRVPSTLTRDMGVRP